MPDDQHLADLRSHLTPELEDDLGHLVPDKPSDLRALTDDELFRLVRKVAFANLWHVSDKVQFEATGRQIAAINDSIAAIDSLLRETQDSNRNSKRTSRISLTIAALALAISLFAGVTDYLGDKDWQDDQTRLLTQIRDRLP